MNREAEWWKRAKDGEEQDPLVPCCMRYDESGFSHDEPSCTRYRYDRPKPITGHVLEEVNRAWDEMIEDLRKSE